MELHNWRAIFAGDNMTEIETIIIGAGSAGLACYAALKHKGREARILERSPNVASRWRGHYDRLHLHTDKNASSLPFKTMPGDYPKYPSRDQVVAYMEDYAREHNAHVEFNTEVERARRVEGKWKIDTVDGRIYMADNLIVSTGKTNKPRIVSKPGLQTFRGKVIHSCEYKNGSEFSSKNVLVIGFGNSACEIAMCLHEHGARPVLSVRSPVNVVPRDILGIPALSIGKLTSRLAPKVSDRLNKPIINFLYGDIEKYGLRKLPYGPVEQIRVHGRIPLLDIGTIDLIRSGDITVRPDIRMIEGSSIEFVDGTSASFDAIVMATGYKHGLEKFIELDEARLGDLRKPVNERPSIGKDSLYLCGLFVSPRGMLNEAGQEALFIAEKIAAKS